MVNSCSVYGCYNKKDDPKIAVFKIPKEEEIRKRWLKFLNRRDLNENSSYIFVCEKHFEEQYLNRDNKQRVRFRKGISPVPTIQPQSVVSKTPSSLPNLPVPRKPPKVRIFRPDEIHSNAYRELAITDFSQINESLLKWLDGYTCETYHDYVMFYKIDNTKLPVSKITEAIRIDHNLHIQLFHESRQLPLPKWFRKGGTCVLKSVTELENFPPYIRLASEDINSSIADELYELKFRKKPQYSTSLIRYSLMLRYTSLQSYNMLREEFRLPTAGFLRNYIQGSIDSLQSAKLLLSKGPLSEDIILMFDEMYLQKSEDYVGGELYGSNEKGELFSGIVCFMIVGLKSNVSLVVKAVPVTKMSSGWLKEEIKGLIELLQSCTFKVK